jgi:ADP-ribose pyrophosphatase YjhB (NUDIX family)
MGGHDEGERDAAATALREAREESGLTRLRLDEPLRILDVDVHAIPERPGEPGHLHLDVRFVVWADGAEPLQLDPAESQALRWWPLDEAAARLGEVGAERVVAKLRARLDAQAAP